MKWAYQAFDKSGKPVSATIEAGDEAAAREDLRRQGLFVMECKAASSTSSAGGKSKKRPSPGRRLKNLAGFTRQLHVLVSSGTPTVQALAAIERQTAGDFRQVVAALREHVEEGRALSEALQHHRHYFDDACCSLVSAGEASGNMPVMLERLASLVRKQLQLRSWVIGALAYPVVLLGAGIVVVIMMLLFVLPRFVGLFETLDVPLPATTKLLVFLSQSLQDYWWVMLPTVIGSIWGGRRWLASVSGQRTVQSVSLLIPRIGDLVKNLATAQMSRLLGVLLECQVPLLDALRLTRESCGHFRYVELIQKAEDAVTRGEPMSTPFTQSDLINPSVSEAMRNGEQSGRVGPLLIQISDFLDQENETVVRALASILEPLILVGLGILVAFIVLSLFMPLFDLTALTQGGGH